MGDEKPSSKNDEGVFEPFEIAAVPWDGYDHGERFGVRFQELGAFGGGTHVGVCLEELAPGKRTYPLHYHMLEEEHVYVLEGRMTLRLGGRRFELRPGMYVCFPAGQKVGHSLDNHTDAPCRYLIIGERNPAEVVVYPDSGRVGVRLLGEGYRGSATMGYWEDEPEDDAPGSD
ncbi:MAG: cupin [Deltaproteobacteria bacterium HGW-Deltaproteobacteria-14]|nr:MAG: cupin [Deltaproteobacteria bacterium HGW-Deltaproteobacteria-14]